LPPREFEPPPLKEFFGGLHGAFLKNPPVFPNRAPFGVFKNFFWGEGSEKFLCGVFKIIFLGFFSKVWGVIKGLAL